MDSLSGGHIPEANTLSGQPSTVNSSSAKGSSLIAPPIKAGTLGWQDFVHTVRGL